LTSGAVDAARRALPNRQEVPMLKLLCALMLAAALSAVPTGIAPQISGQARAETAPTADDAKQAKKREKAEKKKAKKKERTEKQKAAAAQAKQCGAEYQEAKKAGKLAKQKTWRATWQKYRSECMARLKGK
jgi:flagellar biosynthesis/type III secretory pathway protein FliH